MELEGVFEAVALTHFVHHLGDGVVDFLLEHREFCIHLVFVLLVEFHHRLHARRASEDAVAALSLFHIEVVVETVVEFLHDGLISGRAEDFSTARCVEFLDEELSEVVHITHGAVSIVRDVDGL